MEDATLCKLIVMNMSSRIDIHCFHNQMVCSINGTFRLFLGPLKIYLTFHDGMHSQHTTFTIIYTYFCHLDSVLVHCHKS